MASYQNVIILMLASFLLGSVMSDFRVVSALFPPAQSPSVVDVPTESPVEPPTESPVEPPKPDFPVEPQAPTPAPVEPLAPSPIETRAPTPSPVEPLAPTPGSSVAPTPSPVKPLSPSPVESPEPTHSVAPEPSSIWMPPADAPAPESNAGLMRVSVGLVCFGAILGVFMA